MSLATHATATEAEVIRVYNLALSEDEAKAFTAEDVAVALGVAQLDAEYVDIFAVHALDQFGLKGYLTEGLGIQPDALEQYQPKIDSADGHIVVVLSKAFQSQAVDLKNGHPLRLIGAFREGRAESIEVDLTSEATVKQAPKKQKSQAAQSGMVATLALLFMFAFVALIVWIA